MTNKLSSIKSIILPSKKINIFVLIILILGITFGAIFSNIINLNDKTLVIDKIKLFISNIDTNSINNLSSLKNSLATNLVYITIIWILGMTIIGIIPNIFILFIKSFITGFTMSAFIITYSYKGIILSAFYLILGQLLNLIIITTLTIYSIMFQINIIKNITHNNQNNNLLKYFKNYLLILAFSIILSIISSLIEVYFLKALIKIIIKLFI